jgi:hypothetical protein
MLSDTLSELECDIDSHQDAFPHIYCDNRSAIDKVRMLLSSLRCYYDTPPLSELAAPLNNLLHSLNDLDTSAVTTCSDTIYHRDDCIPGKHNLHLLGILIAAMDKIEYYQETMPDIYAPAEAAIDNTMVVVSALADYCLFLPAPSVKPLLTALMHSIRSLDTSRIDATRIRLYEAWDALPRLTPHPTDTACPTSRQEELG